MIYLIKMIYNLLIMPPSNLIILMFILAFWLRIKQVKQWKSLIAIASLLYIVSIPLVGDLLITSLEARYTPPEQLAGDVIVMLGGGATSDTPNVYGSGHLTGNSANRLLTAVQLHNQIQVPIIVSGGKVFEWSGNEGDIAKRIMSQLNVPEKDIILENKSLNTSQNALYTKEVLEEQGFEKPIVVTSAFHMYRSVLQFEKVGIEVIPYPTGYQANIHKIYSVEDFIPRADALMNVRLTVKEYVGILASKWY